MPPTTIPKERYAIWLAAAAFLAPLLGGQLSLDPLPLAPGELLGSIWAGPQGAFIAHFLIFLPLLLGLLFALSRRAVLQVPHMRVTVLWGIFMLSLVVSVVISGYRYPSLGSLAEWLAYLIAFFATVALAGRGAGPRWVVGGFAAGASLSAAMGVWEYVVSRDPTWRVITNWSNPNALAALMILGIFAIIAIIGSPLTARKEEAGILPLFARALSVLGVILCTANLVLTGSKGGYLAFLAGAVVFVLAALMWRRSAVSVLISAIGPALGVVLALVLVAGHSTPDAQPAPGGGFGRLANAGATQEQSSVFRKLLWQSSLSLIKESPMGHGLGTFRYHSAKPGLVIQTQLAHQSYLQMGVEAGIPGMLLFVAGLGLCLIEVLRGSRSLPPENGILRAGILAALVAMGVHSLFDSDFSMFGLGFMFFMLLGALFQLSTDATAPEFAPKPFRALWLAFGTLTAGLILYLGMLDLRLCTLRYAIQTRDTALAQTAFDAAMGMAPGDPRVWYLGSSLAPDKETRTQRLQKSIDLGPTLVAYRTLADALQEQGNYLGAKQALDASLRQDPYNLFSLKRLLDLQAKNNPDLAPEVARRLVAVEETPYFKVRALPELIPTETYEARAFLANSLQGTQKAEMLKPAVQGFVTYAQKTVPSVVTFVHSNMDGGYGGITRAEALAKMQLATTLADQLAEADHAQADDAKGAKAAFADAIQKLSS